MWRAYDHTMIDYDYAMAYTYGVGLGLLHGCCTAAARRPFLLFNKVSTRTTLRP